MLDLEKCKIKWLALTKPIIMNNLDNVDGALFQLYQSYKIHYPHLNKTELLEFSKTTINQIKSCM